MRTRDYNVLGLLLNAATQWHTDGSAVDVEITEIRALTPDKRSVILIWQSEETLNEDGTTSTTGEWVINTSV